MQEAIAVATHVARAVAAFLELMLMRSFFFRHCIARK